MSLSKINELLGQLDRRDAYILKLETDLAEQAKKTTHFETVASAYAGELRNARRELEEMRVIADDAMSTATRLSGTVELLKHQVNDYAQQVAKLGGKPADDLYSALSGAQAVRE
jgi:chromosome segregation ATPase